LKDESDLAPGFIGESAVMLSVLHADINQIYPFEAGRTAGTVRYPDPTYLNGHERRSLVRAIFAFVEANSFSLRQILLKSFKEKLSAETQLALAELQIEITSSGAVKTKVKNVGALSMLRLTICTFASVLPPLSKLKCSGPGYEALVRSIRIRDRLMHPKSYQALNVTDPEIHAVVDAFLWFEAVMVKVIQAVSGFDRDELLREYGLEIIFNIDPFHFEIVRKARE
jgi:hypothetical protein